MGWFPMISSIKVNRAREYFFEKGTVPAGLIPEVISRSWERSLTSGMTAAHDPGGAAVTGKKFSLLQEKNRDLIKHSRPVMDNLYEQIIQTSSIILLADSTGVVLHSVGDLDFIGKARKVSLEPGGIWSEEARGTNAIGTALWEHAPVMVHNAEHYVTANHFLCSSASPIFDPHGRMMGILDVSGSNRVNQQHTMALVQISARQIENQMFSRGFESELVLHLHVRSEFVGTLYEGIVVFSQDGSFLAANRSALLHLGIDRYQAASHSFATLFEDSIEKAFAQPGQFAQPVRQLRTRNGAILFCRAKTRLIRSSHVGRSAASASTRSHEDRPVLEDLELGDPGMRRIIAKARKLLGHDIPVLIEGDSGTGKELFAQAMHYSGPRRSGPFVALNCAALPEGLIESELFGYHEGAFTGARRKGYTGKIRQAEGGTLFLDEICDMPLPFQARLLRVLQERTVSPLGSSDAHGVDFALVCATNRKIRDEVVAGRFREDLYYRLNGLLVTLPRLEERVDQLALAQTIIDSLNKTGRAIRLDPQVGEIFNNHPWPGNIRQMQNVLRTAMVLLGQDGEISREHLPEDFLKQYGSAPNPPAECGLGTEGGAVTLEELERQAVRKAMQESGGNIAAAARTLGISRNTLYRKLDAPAP